MENKEFAEKNAGKYFWFKKMKVRVVGYHAFYSDSIMVTIPRNGRCLCWGEAALDNDDVFVIQPNAIRYRYVNQRELSLLCETKKI